MGKDKWPTQKEFCCDEAMNMKAEIERLQKQFDIVVADARLSRKKLAFAQSELIVRGIKLENDCVAGPCPDVLLIPDNEADDDEIDRVNRMATRELLNCSAFG